MQNIWRGRELKIYDELKSIQQALKDEFFAAHPNYEGEGGYTYIGNQYPRPDSWVNYCVKYEFDGSSDEIKAAAVLAGQAAKIKFPTAAALVEKYGDDCNCASYAVFDANSVIRRHSGIENREAKMVRIHIPLLVPEGDIGFEVDSEEVTWDDIFAFDNQKLHSAWNNTNEKRLIFIIDVSRTVLDLPPGTPWIGKEAEAAYIETHAFDKSEFPAIEIN
jgi:hypothetical protein